MVNAYQLSLLVLDQTCFFFRECRNASPVSYLTHHLSVCPLQHSLSLSLSLLRLNSTLKSYSVWERKNQSGLSTDKPSFLFLLLFVSTPIFIPKNAFNWLVLLTKQKFKFVSLTVCAFKSTFQIQNLKNPKKLKTNNNNKNTSTMAAKTQT